MNIISTIVLLFIIISPVLGQHPWKIYCLDQTSTNCYIVNAFLTKNDSHFIPVSKNPMNVNSLYFESSTIPHITKETCKAFPNLRTIDAQKLAVEEVDEDSFVECINLVFIDFGQNKITHLGANTFNRNSALKTISLHDNNLATIDVNLFRNLPNLWRLVLSINELTEVPAALFRDLTNLGELTLHHNRLTDLDATQLVKYCPKLSIIHLRDNDFHCDQLQTMLDVFTKAHVTFWDYTDNLRSRNYTVEFIQRMECLNDEQFEMEMQTRKNLTRKIVEIEKELDVWKERLLVEEEELKGSNYRFFLLGVCAVLLVIGVVVGYVVVKRRRSQIIPLDILNERIVETDFSNDQL